MRLKTFFLISLLTASELLATAPLSAAQKAAHRKARVKPAPPVAEAPDAVEPPEAPEVTEAPVIKQPLCQLMVTIDNLRKNGDQYRGQLCYTLFKGKEGFPDKSEQAVTNQCVPVQQSPSLTFTVKDLACNQDYGLALLHDENMNRQLDKNLAIPKEGVGMSNNPSFLRVNSPPYDDVKFVLQPPRTSQVVHIHYF
jgi:uncharacterized protein (DUF2141 family)